VPQHSIDLGGDDTPKAFKKIANIPMPDGRLPAKKAKDIDDVFNWIRSPKDNKEGPETALSI
jgi:hypothetical protein